MWRERPLADHFEIENPLEGMYECGWSTYNAVPKSRSWLVRSFHTGDAVQTCVNYRQQTEQACKPIKFWNSGHSTRACRHRQPAGAQQPAGPGSMVNCLHDCPPPGSPASQPLSDGPTARPRRGDHAVVDVALAGSTRGLAASPRCSVSARARH